MKILLVITGLGRGGAERQVCDLADRFAQMGHTVCIVYLFGEALLRPLEPAVTLKGLQLRNNPISLLRTLYALIQVIRSFKPDIVHSHMVHANLLTRCARLFIPMPKLICTAHNANEGGRIRMLLYRLSNTLADLSTNVSQEAVDTFIAKGAVKSGQMIAVYNGIDTERFTCNAALRTHIRTSLGIDEKTPLLLCVGRLEVQKNYPMMLHAFALALKTRPDLYLCIAGEGYLHDVLVNLCDHLHIQKQVRFLGFRTDIAELMSASDLFCLSSDFEGFGLVVAEAMASALLVVTTDCGGVKEVLGGYGFLSPVGDSETFAQCLLDALNLPNERKKALLDAAKARIDAHFSLDRIALKWINLYQDTQTR
ncbi:MAG: glycosyltransferase [Campylobacterales bacterium]|nr:glycosyltransferase [Campylobacterales bacterium]